jgi:radical SAM-linked protein
MAYSAGFTPHPKISYVGAAPTGVASEAEYLEIGLAERVEPEELRAALDAVLPDGLDLVEAVEATGGSLAERIAASHWRLELVGAAESDLASAIEAFLERTEVLVERLTKDGKRTIDARPAVLRLTLVPGDVSPSDCSSESSRAILEVVVAQATPAVRPDDVLAALRSVSGLALAAPPGTVRAQRLAQGPLDGSGVVGDPLAADRVSHVVATTIVRPTES